MLERFPAETTYYCRCQSSIPGESFVLVRGSSSRGPGLTDEAGSTLFVVDDK